MNLDYPRFQCPYYTDTAGEYYLGCWEFTNICEISPVLQTDCHCSSKCPLGSYIPDEKGIINLFIKTLNKPRQVGYFGKSYERSLTEQEKSEIICLFNSIFSFISQYYRGINSYK